MKRAFERLRELYFLRDSRRAGCDSRRPSFFVNRSEGAGPKVPKPRLRGSIERLGTGLILLMAMVVGEGSFDGKCSSSSGNGAGIPACQLEGFALVRASKFGEVWRCRSFLSLRQGQGKTDQGFRFREGIWSNQTTAMALTIAERAPAHGTAPANAPRFSERRVVICGCGWRRAA